MQYSLPLNIIVAIFIVSNVKATNETNSEQSTPPISNNPPNKVCFHISNGVLLELAKNYRIFFLISSCLVAQNRDLL